MSWDTELRRRLDAIADTRRLSLSRLTEIWLWERVLQEEKQTDVK